MVVYHWDQSTLAPKMSTNSCFQKSNKSRSQKEHQLLPEKGNLHQSTPSSQTSTKTALIRQQVTSQKPRPIQTRTVVPAEAMPKFPATID